MPVFMVERRFAEELEVDPETAASINRINDEGGVRWLKSFLSSDKRKTFCLYEAVDVDSIRTAGIPADAIMELSGTLSPDGSFAPM